MGVLWWEFILNVLNIIYYLLMSGILMANIFFRYSNLCPSMVVNLFDVIHLTSGSVNIYFIDSQNIDTCTPPQLCHNTKDGRWITIGSAEAFLVYPFTLMYVCCCCSGKLVLLAPMFYNKSYAFHLLFCAVASNETEDEIQPILTKW